MNIVNGKEREVVEILRGYSLNGYEAKAYFTLLAVGESKTGDVACKAGVPQSKVYDMLDNIHGKGTCSLFSDKGLEYCLIRVITSEARGKWYASNSVNSNEISRRIDGYNVLHRLWLTQSIPVDTKKCTRTITPQPTHERRRIVFVSNDFPERDR